AHAPPLERGIHLGVDEDDASLALLVHDEARELPVQPDLVATLPGVVADLGAHGCDNVRRARLIPSGGVVSGAEQAVGDGLLEGLPRRGDDVVLDADRAPLALAVAGLDEHPRA